MICPACGVQLPDDAAFCYKCGTKIGSATTVGGQGMGGVSQAARNATTSSPKTSQIIASTGVTSLTCPSCGAPITPKFGEMIITCEYCGNAVTLGTQGWSNVQRQTMLSLKIATTDDVNSIIKSMMDRGLLHRHLQEHSTQEEVALSYVPYWIVSVSARTSVVATDEAQQIGQTATSAALMGIILGGLGGGFGGGMGGGFGRRALTGSRGGLNGLLRGAFPFQSILAFGMGYGGGGARKAEEIDANYNFPVVALKDLSAYQPRDYQFDLDGRTFFDISKIPKNIKVLNGDISEDAAKSQAKTFVDQLQSDKAHAKYHMIQQITTQSDVGDVELLHAPIWFARYDHKDKKIVLIIDASSGGVINSIGL